MATLRKGILSAPRGRVGNAVYYRQNGQDIVRAATGKKQEIEKINQGDYGQNIKNLGILIKTMPLFVWEVLNKRVDNKTLLIQNALKKNKKRTPQIDTRNGNEYYFTNFLSRNVPGQYTRGIFGTQFTGTDFGNSIGIVKTSQSEIYYYIVHIESKRVIGIRNITRPTGYLFSGAYLIEGNPTGLYLGLTFISSADFEYISNPLVFSAFNPGL